MQADEQHVGALVKNALRAVAVVVVHIEHGHACGAAIAQGLGRHRGVVQKAVAAHEVGAGMMTGRAAAAEHATLATLPHGQQGGRAGGGIGTGLGCRPGARSQRRAIVHGIQAQPGNEVDGLNIAAQGPHRPDRGKGLALVIAGFQCQPVAPGVLQKREVARRMHLGQHGPAVGLRRPQ